MVILYRILSELNSSDAKRRENEPAVKIRNLFSHAEPGSGDRIGKDTFARLVSVVYKELHAALAVGGVIARHPAHLGNHMFCAELAASPCV